MQKALLIAAGLGFLPLWTVPATAGVRWATPSGAPLHRADYRDIHFKLSNATAQRLTDGDPVAAIQAALNSWNSLPNVSLHFAPLESTAAGPAQDGQNVIAFADSAASVAAVGPRVAVTQQYYSPDGTLLESDIILNPAVTFSTTLKPGTYDLQAVITHELGHALGSNHATVVSATMFWNTLVQDNSQAVLKADDAEFASQAYPAGADTYGRLVGTALKDGAPLLGAAVVAIEMSTGTTIGTISSTNDGSFIVRVPPGSYMLFAYPLPPLIPPDVMYGLPVTKIDPAFKAAAAGGGTAFRVDPGANVNASIATIGGSSAISITANAGVTLNGGSLVFGPAVVQSGSSIDLIVVGPGLNGSITEQNLQLIGPGATIKPGSLRVDNNITFSDGSNPLRFTINVASGAPRGALSLFFQRGQDTAFLAGAVTIVGAKPSFTAASIGDAASGQAAGVSPGELVSLYGSGVGPATPAINGLDASGNVSRSLAGVTVTFDGVAAPLLFVSSGQINLQVPYEVAGKASTTIVVTNQGTASDPVTAQVIPAQPGIFAALNQDFTLNAASSAAPAGTYVTLYATGGGQVTPALPTGKPAPVSPLSYVQPVSATVSGINATVYQNSGVLAPGFIGLLQVAVQIPSGTAKGPVPVTFTVAGRTSPPATIYVK